MLTTAFLVVSHASIAMVVMIYLFVIGYSASWGPIPWVYVSEIFPTRLRSYGVGLAASTQWLFSFAITYLTPSAIYHIGWRIFLMFGIFCLANGVFVFFFVKETKGRTLEDMEIIFGNITEEQRHADVERVLHKSILHDEATGTHEEHVNEDGKGVPEVVNKPVAATSEEGEKTVV